MWFFDIFNSLFNENPMNVKKEIRVQTYLNIVKPQSRLEIKWYFSCQSIGLREKIGLGSLHAIWNISFFSFCTINFTVTTHLNGCFIRKLVYWTCIKINVRHLIKWLFLKVILEQTDRARLSFIFYIYLSFYNNINWITYQVFF